MMVPSIKKHALLALCLLVQLPSFARGVSPYLPLNLAPEIESQIERVMILADMPVMTRPIAAARVLQALEKAQKSDPVLCERVRNYLERYEHRTGVALASIEGASSSGDGRHTTDPNRYGMTLMSKWDAAGQVFWQAGDHLLLNAGAVAYQGKTDFTGSLVSFGWDFAQVDVGFRPHWFSPLSDSSLLMSTEAPTMPSVTVSNYRPLTRFGLHYELFAARMSQSDHIVFNGGFTQGHPRLAGIHLDMEPAEGWSLGLNRLIQYGGGALGGSSIHDLFRAFFNPSAAQTPTGNRQAFGNQEASVTSNLVFPGRIPFVFYVEYAGEDTSRGKNYLLGNSALSMGVHFPLLWKRFDLTLEASEWQNAWYVHNVYLDGMTNYGRVTGNWFGDQRVYGDGVGGRSQTMKMGWQPPFGGLFQLTYRRLQNELYTGFDYKLFQDVSFGYSRPWQDLTAGAQVDVGRDVFGAKFTRLSGFLRYGGESSGLLSSITTAMSSDEVRGQKQGELFVDAGANGSRSSIDLNSPLTKTHTRTQYGYHFAVGARRFVSNHSDLGTRLEVDQANGHDLLGVRLLDYRFHYRGPLALSVFIGAARYNLETPAYGFYYGAGLQYRDVVPGWDIGVDVRYNDTIARDHLLPTDPPNIGFRNDSFYNILSPTLTISRRF